MKTFFRAQAAPWHQGVSILIGDAEGKTRAVIQLEKLDEMCVTEPSFHLETDQAQTLMDDLWNAGIRPTEGSGSAGALRAVERHLEDMRTLVFKPTTP